MGAVEGLDVVFPELINNHLHDFVDVLERLALGGTLRDRAISTQDWAVGVEAAFVGFNDNSKGVCPHRFRFQCTAERSGRQIVQFPTAIERLCAPAPPTRLYVSGTMSLGAIDGTTTLN